MVSPVQERPHVLSCFLLAERMHLLSQRSHRHMEWPEMEHVHLLSQLHSSVAASHAQSREAWQPAHGHEQEEALWFATLPGLLERCSDLRGASFHPQALVILQDGSLLSMPDDAG